MSHRVLRKAMRAWRIGDPRGRYPIYSGDGAALVEGRWHDRGQRVIYASQSYSTALLEKLVHFNGVLPDGQHFIEIDLPVGISYEHVTKDSLPGWDDAGSGAARVFGSAWFGGRRSAVLIVPSFVAREEWNVLINPEHTDAGKIDVGLEKPVRWDSRLFT